MKFERNSKYTTIAIYALLVLAAAIVFNEVFRNLGVVGAFFSRVAGYLQPVVNGVVFAFLLNPLLRAVERRMVTKKPISHKLRRGVCLAVTYLFAGVLVGVFFAIVIPQVFESISNLGNNLSVYFKRIDELYYRLVEWTSGLSDENTFEAYVADILLQLTQSAQMGVERLFEYGTQMLLGILTATQRVTTAVLNLVLGLIVSIYILTDREKLFAQLKKTLRAVTSERVYNLLLGIAQDSNSILSGFLVGKVIDSTIIGILCFIGVSILRLPYAVLISLIVGITNIIPYFGPIVGAIPGVIILAVQSPVQALWFAVFILLLQQFDGNILGPKILGDSIGLSPLWIIFSIMLFSGLLGIPGMFIGVPLFAILYNLVRRLLCFLLERKGQRTHTAAYSSEKNPLPKQKS